MIIIDDIPFDIDDNTLNDSEYYGPGAYDINHGLAAPMKHCYECMRKTHHYRMPGNGNGWVWGCLVCDISFALRMMGT